jgi:hypothetical protein
VRLSKEDEAMLILAGYRKCDCHKCMGIDFAGWYKPNSWEAFLDTEGVKEILYGQADYSG